MNGEDARDVGLELDSELSGLSGLMSPFLAWLDICVIQ